MKLEVRIIDCFLLEKEEDIFTVFIKSNKKYYKFISKIKTTSSDKLERLTKRLTLYTLTDFESKKRKIIYDKEKDTVDYCGGKSWFFHIDIISGSFEEVSKQEYLKEDIKRKL